MLFYKQIRDEIVNLGRENLLKIKQMYLIHQKTKIFTKDNLIQYQKKIAELHASANIDFYSIVQDFWDKIDRNTKEYSKEIKEILNESVIENSEDLEKNINSNFSNSFKFFENLNNSFLKSNSSYCKLSDKNFENFKILIEKVNNIIKEFSLNCEEILSSFEKK